MGTAQARVGGGILFRMGGHSGGLSNRRLDGLDTLRAGAIVLVMVYHLNLQGLMPAAVGAVAAVGWVGVDLFFVLSGYLIGMQLLEPYVAGRKPSLREFYVRRAYRILPAYLAVLALYCWVPLWREAPGPGPVWQYLTFTWNVVLAGYPTERAFSHVWSLCVEEHFYLLLPLLLMGARRLRVRGTCVALAAVVVGGVAVRAGLLHWVVLAPLHGRGTAGGEQTADPLEHSWVLLMRCIYYPTYARLDGLVCGVGLALLRSFRPGWWARLARRGNVWLAGGVAVVTGALWLCGFGFPSPELPASGLFSFPLLATGFGMLVIAAMSEGGVLRVRVPGARWLAGLAYSLYLTHKSVAHAVHRLLPGVTAQADWRSAGVYGVACVGCATVLFYGIERPFLRLRAGRRGKVLVEREVRVDPAL
jgi:peptidoglycan/LPS O-acetylase OafA/YrhL